MKINSVWSVILSPTGTTKKMVNYIAHHIAEKLNVPVCSFDFSTPIARQETLEFGKDDLVILGTPVYAGRVPNLMTKYISSIKGNGALGVPVVMFGNRNFDDALIELRDIMENDGFKTIAAGAFVGEHAFSKTLGAGRPDAEDFTIADKLIKAVYNKITNTSFSSPIEVAGTPYPYNGYYQPRDRYGNPIDIRKVKPLTNENCDNCGICADICPMGCISKENFRDIDGICIKCCACVKRCPKEAKYFDDKGYLYHKTELEEIYTRRAVSQIFK